MLEQCLHLGAEETGGRGRRAVTRAHARLPQATPDAPASTPKAVHSLNEHLSPPVTICHRLHQGPHQTRKEVLMPVHSHTHTHTHMQCKRTRSHTRTGARAQCSQCTRTHMLTHTHAHTYMHTHTQLHIGTHARAQCSCANTHMCAHTHVYAHAPTCSHTSTHALTHAQAHTCSCAHTFAHTHTHVQVHAHTHTLARAPPEAAAVVELPVGQVALHQVHVQAAGRTGAADGAARRGLALGRRAS